jgi:hypothetical protein
MNMRIYKNTWGMALAILIALPLRAGKQEKGLPSGGEEFFIISSVNLAKNQLVLKHPTEVTELMLVTDKTSCLDEQGKTFACKSLRAGDTVYVSSNRNGKGPRTAVRIRLGPMTIDEVHRKYVSFQ